MKFITYNIQFGKGLDGKIDLDRTAAAVEDADIIALQEVETYFPRSGYVDQVRELARRLNSHYWVYGAGVNLHARDDSAVHTNKGHRQQFGNMLLSRTPILSSRNHLLPKSASIGPLSIQRSALEGVILCGSKTIRVYSIHLTHISAEMRYKQVERILEIDRTALWEGGHISGDATGTVFADQTDGRALPREAVLLGDFNFTPDSSEYNRVVGPKSDYGGRVAHPEGFVDAWVVCGNDELSGVTAERLGEDVRMDYCFASSSLRHQVRAVEINSKAIGSDHKPMTMWIDC